MTTTHFESRTACPCCDATDVQELRRLPYSDPVMRRYLDEFYREVGEVDHQLLTGAVYVLTECRVCGLIFQRDVPDAYLSNQLYEVWMNPERVYERYERNANLQKLALLGRQVAMSLRLADAPPGTLKVLDFGMGWGRWCQFAAAYGCDTYGLEISPVQVAHARRHGIHVLNYDELSDHTFDVINAEQVFEHVGQPRETLRYLTQRLKPTGVMWLSVPNGADIRQRLERWDWTADKGSKYSLNAVAPLEHLNCFNPTNFYRLAADAGLRPVTVPSAGHKATAGQPRRGLRRLFGGRNHQTPAADAGLNRTEHFFARNE